MARGCELTIDDAAVDRDCAAVASARAAELYGLEMLDKGIQDDQDNFTRFILLSREPTQPGAAAGGMFKTSIVFSLAEGAPADRACDPLPQPSQRRPACCRRCGALAHDALASAAERSGTGGVAGSGELFKALSCFALRGIDLTKIERCLAAPAHRALPTQAPRRPPPARPLLNRRAAASLPYTVAAHWCCVTRPPHHPGSHLRRPAPARAPDCALSPLALAPAGRCGQPRSG